MLGLIMEESLHYTPSSVRGLTCAGGTGRRSTCKGSSRNRYIENPGCLEWWTVVISQAMGQQSDEEDVVLSCSRMCAGRISAAMDEE